MPFQWLHVCGTSSQSLHQQLQELTKIKPVRDHYHPTSSKSTIELEYTMKTTTPDDKIATHHRVLQEFGALDLGQKSS